MGEWLRGHRPFYPNESATTLAWRGVLHTTKDRKAHWLFPVAAGLPVPGVERFPILCLGRRSLVLPTSTLPVCGWETCLEMWSPETCGVLWTVGKASSSMNTVTVTPWTWTDVSGLGDIDPGKGDIVFGEASDERPHTWPWSCPGISSPCLWLKPSPGNLPCFSIPLGSPLRGWKNRAILTVVRTVVEDPRSFAEVRGVMCILARGIRVPWQQ